MAKVQIKESLQFFCIVLFCLFREKKKQKQQMTVGLY